MIGGSIFSGIEGLGLGLLWSRLITSIAFQVENDAFCRRVLAARFPHVDRSIADVRRATAQSIPRCDVLFGGPPCQDVSGAGRGAGLDGERSGLVREMLRVAAELKPGVVLVENVASGARRWVCPVRGALEAIGYRTRALNIGVDDCGGPHRRRRIFVLAYARRVQGGFEHGGGGGPCREDPPGAGERGEAMADSAGSRWTRGRGAGGEHSGWARPAHDDSMGHADRLTECESHDKTSPLGERRQGARSDARGADGRLAESGLGPLPNGIPPLLVRWPVGPGAEQAAWEPPRTLQGVAERPAKLRAIGNAVSPIQAYHVGLWARQILLDT